MDESSDDIYNSLPVEYFTYELEDVETDSLGSELENYTFESEISQDTPSDSSISFEEEAAEKTNLSSDKDDENMVSESLNRLKLSKDENYVQNIKIPSPSSENKLVSNDEDSKIWICCARCGKKNEIDCNFCGKCGLQIHKIVSIVESDTKETLSPEVSRNIKYHYKRPVFCFGPRGNCFASFSSPSKSVRNVAKFRLSTLTDFKNTLEILEKKKVIVNNFSSAWNEENFKDSNWELKDCILKKFTAIISSKTTFSLDEPLRIGLREYFANIAPKDLGAIKILATQDCITYSRSEIDQIFHLLVIGKTMEACELCITFNYWDHALIIAKTLETEFYEKVMNRFLNSRFDNGHPLRILYLIMTNNENSALEEIRNMINNQEMPKFVQEIWSILVNFLLRAKHESLVISKIFEDIAKCLFDQKLFENSLICYIISILSGSKSLNLYVIEKIDYLLTWFLHNNTLNTLNFSGIHLLNVFIHKFELLNSAAFMWRSQFIRLLYAQFLHDMDSLCADSLNRFSTALKFSTGQTISEYSYPIFFKEELSILEARNMFKISKNTTSHLLNRAANKEPLETPAVLFSKDSNTNILTSNFTPFVTDLKPYEEGSDLNQIPDTFSPIAHENFMTDSGLKDPQNPSISFLNDSLSDEMNTISNVSISSLNSQRTKKPQDNQEANVFGKIKSWFPSSKSSTSNPDNQKQTTKAKMGKPNSFRYDEKLKKWVDDSDPSTFEDAPKLPPPPKMSTSSTPSENPLAFDTGEINFRAKKGKVKYFDPLNPNGPNSTQLHPSVLDFN